MLVGGAGACDGLYERRLLWLLVNSSVLVSASDCPRVRHGTARLCDRLCFVVLGPVALHPGEGLESVEGKRGDSVCLRLQRGGHHTHLCVLLLGQRRGASAAGRCSTRSCEGWSSTS